MTNPFPSEDSDLDAAITRAHSHLEQHDADSEEYRNIVSRLTELYALRNNLNKLNLELYEFDNKHTLDVVKAEHEIELEQRPFHQRVNPDVVLTVAANLLIGFAVIKYEQTGVISSKVMSFMKKI